MWITDLAVQTLSVNGVAVIPDTALLADVKTSGTAGGTSASTTWNNRPLNTIYYNVNNIVSLDSSTGQFILIAGDFEALIFSAVVGGSAAGNLARSRLYNVTGAASVQEGVNSGAVTNDFNVTMVLCKFTANGTDAYRVDTYTSVGRATIGLGQAMSDGAAEIYTLVYLRKVA